MDKMPPLKGCSTRLSRIPSSRRSTSLPAVLRTQSRLAALMILVAPLAMISFPSSSASSLTGFLRGDNPGSIATALKGFNSTYAARKSFRVSLKAYAQDNESATRDLHIARKGHTATILSDGKILIIGGENQEGQVEDSEVYDPNDGTFLLTAKLNIARANHTTTKLADGRILVVGGHNHDGFLRSTELFDPKSNRFAPGPSLLQARSGHTATILADGRILIAGGDSNGTAEIFDPTGMKFVRVKGRMTAPRSSHSAMLLKSGEVLLVGGLSPDGRELSSGELLDPENSQFKPTRNPLFGARVRPLLRMLPDGKVQIIGGDDQGSMEMFNTEGRYFTARAKILPDSTSQTSIEEVMRAPSRAALINNHAGQPLVLRNPLDQNETIARLLDRDEYTITELPETFSALVTGGVDGSGTTLTSTMTSASSLATVTTDKTDYQPGETVIITGTNWQPGETVQLTLHRDNDTPDTVLTSVSDQEGNFSNSDYVVQESDLNVAFLLTAVGQTSGYTAQTTFTDSRTIFSVSLNNSSSVAVSPGGSINVVIFVTTSTDGGANWRSTSWLISTTPPGTSTCVDHPNHDGPGFNGEPFSITAPTSPGLYNAYFIAYQDDSCTSGASTTYVMRNAVTVTQPPCTSPTITCPGAVSVQCDSNIPPAATDLASFVAQGGSASPSSPSCGPVTVTFLGDVPSGSCPKTITRTYRATDGSDNQATCTQIITVHDTTAPSIACPQPVTVQCDADVPAHATDLTSLLNQGGSASDNCGVPTVTFVNDVSSGSCPKTITRTYRATDGCGNSTTGTQVITVNDTVAPNISCPAPVTVQCDADVPAHATNLAGLVTQGGNATDNCGSPTVEFVSDVSSGSCPKTITRTYRATDGCGNFREGTQTITVNDTVAPGITCPPPVTVQCEANVPAHASDLAGLRSQGGNASDNCGVPTVRFVSDVPSGSCPKTITRTYRATDGCGNSTDCMQIITIRDTIAPTLTCPPRVTVQCDSDVPAHATNLTSLVAQGGSASDNCGVPTVTFVSDVSSGSCPRIITRTYKATDGCGNETTCTQRITVRDTIAPNITCPSDIAVPGGGVATVVVYPLPTATDNCGIPSVVCSPPSGSVFQIGVTRVTCTATDACANSSSCSFSVSVCYSFLGFFPPVENPPMGNRANAGQTVPLKFKVMAGQNYISDLGTVMYLESANLSDCLRDHSGPLVDERGSSTIHYDSVEHQFVINWKTKKKWSNTCRKFILTLNDGSTHVLYFDFVKN